METNDPLSYPKLPGVDSHNDGYWTNEGELRHCWFAGWAKEEQAPPTDACRSLPTPHEGCLLSTDKVARRITIRKKKTRGPSV